MCRDVGWSSSATRAALPRSAELPRNVLAMAPKVIKTINKKPAAKPDVEQEEEEVKAVKNPAQACMNQLKRLDACGRPFPLKHYKSLRTHAEKRVFASQLSLDKDASFLETLENEYIDEHDECEDRAGWCFLWDVARLNGISYLGTAAQDQFLLGLVAGCEEQEPDDANLKRKGYKQFWYEKKYETKAVQKRGKTVHATAKSELKDAKEYEEVLSLMGGSKAARSSHSSAETNRKAPKKIKTDTKEMDKKKSFMQFFKKASTALNTLESKANGIIEKAKQRTGEPWYSQKFMNALDKEAKSITTTKSKLVKLHALHEHQSPEVFEAKKFTDIQEEVKNLQNHHSGGLGQVSKAEIYLTA